MFNCFSLILLLVSLNAIDLIFLLELHLNSNQLSVYIKICVDLIEKI